MRFLVHGSCTRRTASACVLHAAACYTGFPWLRSTCDAYRVSMYARVSCLELACTRRKFSCLAYRALAQAPTHYSSATGVDENHVVTGTRRNPSLSQRAKRGRKTFWPKEHATAFDPRRRTNLKWVHSPGMCLPTNAAKFWKRSNAVTQSAGSRIQWSSDLGVTVWT